MLAHWPEADVSYHDAEAESQFELLMELVRGLRELRRDYEVTPGRKLTVIAAPGNQRALLQDHSHVFARLCHVHSLALLPAGDAPPADSISLVVGEVTLYLQLAEMIDREAERDRLSHEIERLKSAEARAAAMLANKQFVSRAQPAVVQQQRDKLQAARDGLAQLAEELAKLS